MAGDCVQHAASRPPVGFWNDDGSAFETNPASGAEIYQRLRTCVRYHQMIIE